MQAASERAVHSAPAAAAQPKGQGKSSGILSLVLAAAVAAVVATVVSAAISTAVLLFGPLSAERSGDTGRSTQDAGRSSQQGDVVIGSGDRLEVYYPTGYEGPPNLQLTAGSNDWTRTVQLEEQKPDHFTIKSKRFPNDQTSDKIHWRTQGTLKSK
jgi:hypothetical protein